MIEEAKKSAELLWHCASHTDGTGCLSCPYNLLDREDDPCVNQLFRKGANIIQCLVEIVERTPDGTAVYDALMEYISILKNNVTELLRDRDRYTDQLMQHEKIMGLIQDYINRNHIHCSESIYQMDRPQVEAIDLTAELCRIVGWYEPQEEV